MRTVRSITFLMALTIVAAPLLVFGIGKSASAQPGKWVYLGSATLDGGVDHDKIKCHGKDTYHALQFRVSGAAVQFDRINVVYGNHNSKPMPFRMRVAPNSSSPPLDLVGGARDITYVEFWYEKASWGKKPEVKLYGRP